jgi:hypothetical protein
MASMPSRNAPWPGLSTNASTTSGWVNDARIPEKMATAMMARNGGTWRMLNTISSTSGSRLTGEIEYTSASRSRASSAPTADDDGSAISPTAR